MDKNILGFEKAALNLLISYSCPENLAQFMRVIRKLVATATNPYISAQKVKEVLHEEEPASHALSDDYAMININRPLQDINDDIIRLCLKRNRMNQTKTAKQLEISRSKLWRMLEAMN